MTRIAVDTSAAVPYVMRSHEAHDVVRRALRGLRTVLTAHSLAETYSVLTRLPGDARLDPRDAVTLIDANFGKPVVLSRTKAGSVHGEFASAGIAGGAVYDGLVALAAREDGLDVATRDKRAATTYAAIGVSYELILA